MTSTKTSLIHQAGPTDQIAEYWQMLKLRSWAIYFMTLASTAVVVVVISLLPNTYRATTTILVDPQKVPDELVPSTVKSPLTERLQTISQEVLSGTRLQSLIEENHLYPDMRTSLPSDRLLEYMRNQIQISVKHASGSGPASFTITYEGRDPVVTAKVTSELAAGFISWNVVSRANLTNNTATFLEGRLRVAETELERQEAKVREFKMRHLGEMPEQTQSNIAELSQLRAAFSANNDSLNRLEQERIELEQIPQLAQGSELRPTPATERSRLLDERVKLEGQLFELHRRYTPAHPEVSDAEKRMRRIDHQLAELPPDQGLHVEEVKSERTPASVRLGVIARETRRLDEEQRRIQDQIASYQFKLDAVPLREQQYVDLTRGYDTAKEQYRSLLTKKYSAEMSADLERKQQGESFTVLDPAQIPEKPSAPRRKLLMIAGFLGSFVLSVLVVVAKDQVRTTVKSERHVQKIFGQTVRVLGTIPTLRGSAEARKKRQYLTVAVFSTAGTALLLAVFLWRIHPIL